MTNDIASSSPIPPGINGSTVSTFSASVIKDVVIEDMIVAFKTEHHVRNVLHKVVRHVGSNTMNSDGRMVGFPPAIQLPNVIVINLIVFG